MNDLVVTFNKTTNGNYFINFQFKVELYDENLIVHKADPFTLINPINDTQLCLQEYDGPKLVIINTTDTTMCEISEDMITQKEVFITNNANCNLRMASWKQTSCIDTTSTNYKIKKPQVKMVNDEFYIYCPGHNITIFDHQNVCPNQVIRLNRNIPFQLDAKWYSITNITELSTTKLTIWSSKINWKLSPIEGIIRIEPLKIKILKESVDLTKQLKKQLSWFDGIKQEIVIGVLSLIAFLIIISISLKCIQTLLFKPVIAVTYIPRNSRKQEKGRTTEHIPLSSLY